MEVVEVPESGSVKIPTFKGDKQSVVRQVVFIADKPEALGSRTANAPAAGIFDETAANSSGLETTHDLDSDRVCMWLRSLGLTPGATWAAIDAAYRSLLSDITPGPRASHGKVALANELLDEISEAYDALRSRLAA